LSLAPPKVLNRQDQEFRIRYGAGNYVSFVPVYRQVKITGYHTDKIGGVVCSADNGTLHLLAGLSYAFYQIPMAGPPVEGYC
jgi:hypothetical protein